jgi:hypothetical protein
MSKNVRGTPWLPYGTLLLVKLDLKRLKRDSTISIQTVKNIFLKLFTTK